MKNPGIERVTRTAADTLVLPLVERLVLRMLVWLVRCWVFGGILETF